MDRSTTIDTESTTSEKKSPWRSMLVLLLLLAGLIVYDGARVQPAGYAHGEGLHGRWSAPPPMQTLRLATFNIHRGVGADGEYDLKRTGAALRAFDLIGLNEVGPEQAEKLGKKLARDWLYVPSEHRWWHDSFGNAVLSSLPVRRWRRIPIPETQAGGLRNCVILRVPFQGNTLNVIITHLGRQRDREEQQKKVLELFLAQDEPAVLMGDMNAKADDVQIARLLATPGVRDAMKSIHAPDSPERIDWIFLRGLDALSAGTFENGASDHPLVWAEVRLPHR